uniref:Uncharacterized protein n=1 Tax=Romanomermis culicivorax TaxID=13658 RepID=A0A915JUZ6_ROMCU
VKISDFGLSRALGAGEEYYRGDLSVSVRLPIACAPECIKFLKFTSASDVWSFGVTLWEMFTYGFQPWLGMTGRQVLDAIDIQRLEMPDDCPSDYYNLMLKCWQHESSARPKFADLVTLLPDIRPELVRTVTYCSDGQPDHLQYDADDLLVLPPFFRPKEYPDGYYWKGVVIEKQLKNKPGCARTGLFSPANTIAHLPATGNFENRSYTCDQISPKIDRKSKDELHKVDKKPIKINRHAIGRPEGDLRHTGHVGIDGSCFGNIGFVPEKNNLPLQVVVPPTIKARSMKLDLYGKDKQGILMQQSA